MTLYNSTLCPTSAPSKVLTLAASGAVFPRPLVEWNPGASFSTYSALGKDLVNFGRTMRTNYEYLGSLVHVTQCHVAQQQETRVVGSKVKADLELWTLVTTASQYLTCWCSSSWRTWTPCPRSRHPCRTCSPSLGPREGRSANPREGGFNIEVTIELPTFLPVTIFPQSWWFWIRATAACDWGEL